MVMPADRALFTNLLVEALPDTPRSGLRLKSFRNARMNFHWHFHPEIELVCVEGGNGVRYVGRSMEPFAAGDLCLIGANVPHAFGSHPVQRKGARWLVGHFLPEVWGERFWALPDNRRVVELLRKSRHGLHFDLQETMTIRKMFAEAEHTMRYASRLAVWLEILDRLACCRKSRILNPISFADEGMDSRLQQVLAWVENHASETEMTQAQAAAKIHLSPQAFCRFFRERTGRPFHCYVNEARVARACAALLNSARPISEIAFETGFNNLANFNRRFREIAGVTPREYRKIRSGASFV